MTRGDDVTVAYPLFQEDRSGSIPTSPLSIIVGQINVHLACLLNKRWHSRFPLIEWSNVVRNKDYVCYAAELNGIYIAVAIWSSPIAANRLNDGESMLELRRMAIAGDAPKNTASRMLSIMRRLICKKFPHIKKLISYQDKDVHSGTIYKASGWVAVDENKGSSWTTKKRTRNPEQSLSHKIRWEYELFNPTDGVQKYSDVHARKRIRGQHQGTEGAWMEMLGANEERQLEEQRGQEGST